MGAFAGIRAGSVVHKICRLAVHGRSHPRGIRPGGASGKGTIGKQSAGLGVGKKAQIGAEWVALNVIRWMNFRLELPWVAEQASTVG